MMTFFYNNYKNALLIFFDLNLYSLSKIVEQLPLIISKENRQSILVVVVFDAIVRMAYYG